jgi:hypothetical protein
LTLFQPALCKTASICLSSKLDSSIWANAGIRVFYAAE